MSSTRLGGQPLLRLLAVGGPELSDFISSVSEGGEKLAEGLAARVRSRSGDRYQIEVDWSPGAPVKDLSFDDLADQPDVVILSLLTDVLGEGRLDIDTFRADTRRVVSSLKDRGSYVFLVNVSTFDPEDAVTSYFDMVNDTKSLRAHKVAAAVIDLSYEQGISVVDADRLLAELGALSHVKNMGRYSPEACEVLCEEVHRILADYGFFEERPLLVQAGAKSR